MAGTANCYSEGRLATKWYPNITDPHVIRTESAKICEKDHPLPHAHSLSKLFSEFHKARSTRAFTGKQTFGTSSLQILYTWRYNKAPKSNHQTLPSDWIFLSQQLVSTDSFPQSKSAL